MKTPVEMMLDGVVWKPTGAAGANERGLPYATYTGILRIGEWEFKVARLSDGRAVIDAESLERFFGDLEADQ
jgi:hypothetical protein